MKLTRRIIALALAILVTVCSAALADQVAPAKPGEEISPTTGLPTTRLRPTTTAFFPVRSIP